MSKHAERLRRVDGVKMSDPDQPSVVILPAEDAAEIADTLDALIGTGKAMADYFEEHIRDYLGDYANNWGCYTALRAAITKAKGDA